MLLFKSLFIVALAATVPAAASAVTFRGEFWDTTASINTIDEALAYIDVNSVDATFRSTAIDNPNGSCNVQSSRNTLASFLGNDAATLSGFGSAHVEGTLLRFTGFLDLLPGKQKFVVGSDDGFRLIIGETELGRANARGFTNSSFDLDAGSGRTAFELVYFERAGDAGVRFSIDGALAAPAVVPLPAALPMLLAGVGALDIVSSRRRKAARAA